MECVDNSFLWLFVIRQDRSRSAALQKTSFPRSKFTRQVFCSFLGSPMCGKSCKHLFNTEGIMDSSISSAWTPHTIFLTVMNYPLWECWYNLSNLTNQRVYQEPFWYTRTGHLKKWLQAPPPLLSPISSHFIFVFVISQFPSRPDYLGAWYRLVFNCLLLYGNFEGVWKAVPPR